MPEPKPIVMPPFVGYGTLEEWLAVVDPEQPVFALKISEPSPQNGGLHVEELTVHCQQVAPDYAVHYCRLRAASVTLCYGEPFDGDWQDREAAWKSLWECVSALLQNAGLAVRKATIARPKNLILLEGRSKRIAYDKESKRYQIK
jgi:hypothetical protein